MVKRTALGGNGDRDKQEWVVVVVVVVWGGGHECGQEEMRRGEMGVKKGEGTNESRMDGERLMIRCWLASWERHTYAPHRLWYLPFPSHCQRWQEERSEGRMGCNNKWKEGGREVGRDRGIAVHPRGILCDWVRITCGGRVAVKLYGGLKMDN